MGDKLIAVRLLEEKLELHGNMVKLDKFLSNHECTREVEARELDLMVVQLKAMREYHKALNMRCYYHANNHAWHDE